MKSLEALTAQIESIQDLQSVVKTMKALAMVSIRQYETAVIALADYNRTVEMGLQILLRHRYFREQSVMLPQGLTNHRKTETLGVIIFGSDHGLCGQFNEQIASYAIKQMNQKPEKPENIIVAAVGTRLIPYLETAKQPISAQFSLPNSVTLITPVVQEMLLMIEGWQFPKVDQIMLVYNKSLSSASYRPETVQLLPMNAQWLQRLEKQAWHGEGLPSFTMNWDELFSALVRQYLFVSLYRAFAESLASENASRLSSMQAAQKNIEERLTELNSQYRHQRQSSITSELLDIVSGFEALNSKE
ncbi:MAG: F0F1 ATP synthase subunit gamma [Richelia sp. RM2_1_2]|nr:F0F1 ATP synthase subunit gamma [Richelia sp. SM1_7_0]NJN10485.1 F0F1 ATP synthase subunit gamma [Richelia sp. RM1_1_1]NJO26398.1 F0F1 ATP synthase subunit gamma [Richelia sp. SL_2_1]NJO57642.1 F0F1 ATP synthase subunit gamma [Richelia sp. RM2_1_2]